MGFRHKAMQKMHVKDNQIYIKQNHTKTIAWIYRAIAVLEATMIADDSQDRQPTSLLRWQIVTFLG